MRKIVLIFFLLSIASASHSQTIYSIPWATTQPAWVFPIYAEDGNGQKDTLYLGFDNAASSYSYDIQDSLYGVKRIDLDTTKFFGIWDNASCANGCKGYKANVTSTIPGADYFPSQYFFGFFKGILPLKISWDPQLFYSDSLPFPSQSPRGQGRFSYDYFIDCNIRENFIQIILPPGDQILLCDSYCHARDSVVIYNYLGNPGNVDGGIINLYVQPWSNGMMSINHLSQEEEEFKIVNNYNTDCIFINGNSDVTLFVQNLLGQFILTKNISRNTNNVLNFPTDGFYLISILNKKKIVKTFKINFYEK